jgi:thiamine pyrophosphokinase
MAHRRAVIFANGEVPDIEAVRNLLQPDDWLVSADGGSRHLAALGLRPHLLVGDMDSIDPQLVEAFEAAGTDVRRHPVEKNETDLELALQVVVEKGSRRVLIVGGLGGRVDQMLANLSLLTRPALASCDTRMDDGHTEVFIIRDSASIHGQPGDTVSLLPFFGAAHGITTGGLKYPLLNESLYPDHTRGISNRLAVAEAVVRVTSGDLCCIHIRDAAEG